MPAQPDQADWSKKRIARFSLVDYGAMGQPTAIISIPDLAVSVPVYPDSVPVSLEAGAAWVTGTASPGTQGNMAIAGHRDSFFRPLEGIPLGTEINLITPDGRQTYTVASINIVDALDISPLGPTDVASLTLITCHPFRYQGFAPNRYIIRAVLTDNNSQQSERANSILQTSMATF